MVTKMSEFDKMLEKVRDRREQGRAVYGDGIYQEPYEFFYWMLQNKLNRFRILSAKPTYVKELKDTVLDLTVYAACLMEKVENENRSV